jgi:flagellin-like protein
MKMENDSGVSVIIATILMVAVTVVLAGVLYVMVIGIGGGGTEDLTPLGSWNASTPVNRTTAKLVFGDFSTDVDVIDLRIYIYEGNSTDYTAIIIPSPLSAQDTPCAVSGHNSSSIDAIYTDYGWTSNHVNAGDYLTLILHRKSVPFAIPIHRIHDRSHQRIPAPPVIIVFLRIAYSPR